MITENENVFLWPIRIYYEDTDSGGVVYYANYLKFMERARTEWLRAEGFEQDELIAKENVIFAVRSVQADYLSPARFNEKLVISTKVIKKGKASITVEQVVKRDKDVLCKATIKIACLSADDFKPAIMPENLYNKIV
ncbi:MAG: tol-pal system-associated acyl-CoA thioesterase [Gammaproteobacteria bacterium]|nr:tol-pal system-associated acyl-CoA thioesterase [Gammaproteobacteria bacterium]MCW8986639.1 tol-pal system-associated acyl-CoA thioesterase [Gammaproteobacteria bacterium]